MLATTSSQVQFVVNGEQEQAELSLHTTLLDFLRASGRTGAKEGCAEGECGACAVVMVNHGGGSVDSCLMLLPMVGRP